MASLPGGYPAARRLDLVEDLFGHHVADPYRWLEDAGSAETRQWLAAEEEAVGGLPRRPARPGGVHRAGARAAARRVRRPARVARYDAGSTPRRDPDQEHAVLYVAESMTGSPGGRKPGAEPPATGRPAGRAERALIDPVAIDPTGLHDARRLAAGQGGAAARLPALARRGRGGAAAGDGRGHRGARRRARSTGAGTPGWRGCPAARRSTTRGGCRPRRCPPGNRSTTGGCTCTWWGRRRRRTPRCSARAGTR